MIYTSYFTKLKELENHNIIPISICAKAPDWYKGLQYKKLAPKYGFFMNWKKNHDNDYYIEHFQAEVLDGLDAATVVNELNYLVPNVNGKNIALICYDIIVNIIRAYYRLIYFVVISKYTSVYGYFFC